MCETRPGEGRDSPQSRQFADKVLGEPARGIVQDCSGPGHRPEG